MAVQSKFQVAFGTFAFAIGLLIFANAPTNAAQNFGSSAGTANPLSPCSNNPVFISERVTTTFGMAGGTITTVDNNPCMFATQKTADTYAAEWKGVAKAINLDGTFAKLSQPMWSVDITNSDGSHSLNNAGLMAQWEMLYGKSTATKMIQDELAAEATFGARRDAENAKQKAFAVQCAVDVEKLYLTVLGRPSGTDTQGKAFWVGQCENHQMTVDQINNAFLILPEYLVKHPDAPSQVASASSKWLFDNFVQPFVQFIGRSAIVSTPASVTPEGKMQPKTIAPLAPPAKTASAITSATMVSTSPSTSNRVAQAPVTGIATVTTIASDVIKTVTTLLTGKITTPTGSLSVRPERVCSTEVQSILRGLGQPWDASDANVNYQIGLNLCDQGTSYSDLLQKLKAAAPVTPPVSGPPSPNPAPAISSIVVTLAPAQGTAPAAVTAPTSAPSAPATGQKATQAPSSDSGTVATVASVVSDVIKTVTQLATGKITPPSGSIAVQPELDSCSLDVESLYVSVLGRASDPSGKENWVRNCRQGMTHTEMLNAFVTSSEYLSRNNSSVKSPQPIQSLNSDPCEDQVENLYVTVLGRPSDLGGKANWVGLCRRQVKTIDQIRQDFMNSQEYRDKQKPS